MNIEMNVEISKSANLPTIFGDFKVQSFKEGIFEHLAIFKEPLNETPLIRIHSECLTGDAIGSLKCDCRDQLAYALEQINTHGGMVLYLRQEGRGIGLLNKINAYAWQDCGLDTVEANLKLGLPEDARTYDIAEFILSYYKIKQINLLTNNPNKIKSLKDIKINQRVPISTPKTSHNKDYLSIKKEKMGHEL